MQVGTNKPSWPMKTNCKARPTKTEPEKMLLVSNHDSNFMNSYNKCKRNGLQYSLNLRLSRNLIQIKQFLFITPGWLMAHTDPSFFLIDAKECSTGKMRTFTFYYFLPSGSPSAKFHFCALNPGQTLFRVTLWRLVGQSS